MTDEQKLQQALRLIPVCEAEIAAGETRPMFFEILEMSYRHLEELGVSYDDYRS